MTPSLPALTIVLALALASAPPQNHPRKSKSAQPEMVDPDLEFTGEIDRGKTYIHDIGHDLQFRLEVAADGDYAGWDISITPKSQPAGEPIEFSAIATPPYHNFNDRYLEITYGSAKEILEMSPRRFNFVTSIDDEHRAEEVVNAMLYPNSVTDDEKQRIAINAANIQLGTAEFSTQKYRITSLKDPLYPGSIEWLKFSVKIKFSSGLTMSQIAAPADTPAK
ncbi:MAG: hypothetical protein ACRD59_11450 [Candidatus Acidiferrales bacterium]